MNTIYLKKSVPRSEDILPSLFIINGGTHGNRDKLLSNCDLLLFFDVQ